MNRGGRTSAVLGRTSGADYCLICRYFGELKKKHAQDVIDEERTVEEQFVRMVSNILARNQDDHVKNIAVLMNQNSDWSLAPAFDVTYRDNPAGAWTGTHRMTLNGRRDGFSLADFDGWGKAVMMKRGRVEAIVAEVQAAVERWREFAAGAKLTDEVSARIRRAHRLDFSMREEPGDAAAGDGRPPSDTNHEKLWTTAKAGGTGVPPASRP